MNNQKINELTRFLSMFQESSNTIHFKVDEEYKCVLVDLDSDRDLINIVNMLGRIGGFYNIQVTVGEPQKHYRISIINFNSNWKSIPAVFP